MNKNGLVSMFTMFFFVNISLAQLPVDVYKMPMKDVLSKIEREYKVTLIYSPTLVNPLTVNYAVWRFANDFKTTMDNVLKPMDFVYAKVGKDSFDVYPYRHHMRTPDQGLHHLNKLLTLYNNAADFEKRKADLRTNILKTMGISLTVERNPLKPIYHSKRIMDGYTIENVAFESFPGYYVTGSLYRPLAIKGKVPAILCPHGHFPDYRNDSLNKQGRYRPDMQYRCASLARMGAVVFNYDMYAWGESMLQTLDTAAHSNGFANAIQTWNSVRIVDFLSSLPNVDVNRIGVTGASGGGTQAFLVAALNKRIAASVPVVMVGSSFYGGCACESGLPIHSCVKYNTNNVEIAAIAAPNPQLLISDGSDWTKTFSTTDFPYLQKVYGFYGKRNNVQSVYLPLDVHDYGITKRIPMYKFFAKYFGLNIKTITGKNGTIDETGITIETVVEQLVFSKDFPLPANALIGHAAIVKAFKAFQGLTNEFTNY